MGDGGMERGPRQRTTKEEGGSPGAQTEMPQFIAPSYLFK